MTYSLYVRGLGLQSIVVGGSPGLRNALLPWDGPDTRHLGHTDIDKLLALRGHTAGVNQLIEAINEHGEIEISREM